MIDQETLGAALAYTNKAIEALKDVVHYIGVTTTALSDGATTNPITINGRSVTAVDGDMVFYNGTAYTWNGTAWQETLSIAQIITQIEELQDAIGNLSNLTTEEKSNLVGAINEIVADIPTKLSDLADDATHRLVTDTEKSTWDAKATTTDITNAINALDVSSVGGTGKYISAISETDGKISATARGIDNIPTAGSPDPVKSGGVFNAINDSVSLKSATGNPIIRTDAANANAEELLMTIEPIQSGSGDPSPTNVRPISGLTEGKVVACGKNIVHIDSTKIYSTDKDPSDPITGIADGMLILGTASNGYIRGVHVSSYSINNANSITVKMANTAGSGVYGVGIVVEIDDTKTYTLNLSKTGGDATVGWLNSDGSSLSYTDRWNIPITLTPPSGAKYAMILCCPGRNAEHTFSDIQLEVGTNATEYKPYTATNATITLGQTVYGGSVNFKTGEVTVTHGNIASYNGESINEPWLSSIDKYVSGATPTTGAQVVYPLTTPTTLTLTPAELELLKGNNTITANGAEISLKYYPDNAIGTLAERVDKKADKEAVDAEIGDLSRTGLTGDSVSAQLGAAKTQINTLNGDNKTIIPANADINNIQYTAVGQYITNGSNKNIQNVPDAVKNLSFYMNVINSLTNEAVQISSAWKERIQIIIPIDASTIYIREVKSNASASDITYGNWQTFLTDKSEVVNYTASDITELHQSITIHEFRIITYGKIVTIGINFSASADIALYTNLLKLPNNIKSYSGGSAIGFITDRTHLGALWVNTSGYLVASSSIPTGTNYQGQIVFIRQ